MFPISLLFSHEFSTIYSNLQTYICDFGKCTQIGVRYGSLSEDFITGYHMQCKGWKSIFCNPKRAAFYGDAPSSLFDALSQTKRWGVGQLQLGFCKYCPLTFGVGAMGPLMGLTYAHYAFWPIWSIPVAIYAFLPQLALLNGVTIFPKVIIISNFYLCDAQLLCLF